MPPAAIIGGATLLSGISGAMGSKSKSTYGVDAGNATDSEMYGQSLLGKSARDLEGFVNAGPGMSDVENDVRGQRDLASMLDQYSKGGYLPNDADIATGNKFAGSIFGAQREQLGQNFQDQTNQFNQQAALMGRDPLDPVFRNKLAQEQTRQTRMLDAEQGSFASQFAMNSPMQRLQFKSQQAQVQSGLASQALANRQSLAAMGEGIMNGERNFRLQTASRWGEQSSGGGIGGAISGGLAGLGAGFGIAKGFAGLTAPNTEGVTPGMQSGTDSFVSSLYGGAGRSGATAASTGFSPIPSNIAAPNGGAYNPFAYGQGFNFGAGVPFSGNQGGGMPLINSFYTGYGSAGQRKG